jgi:replicative DNA helicase
MSRKPERSERAEIPMHSVETEMRVIGSTLLEHDAAQRVVEECAETDFQADPARRLYRAVQRVVRRPAVVDLYLVAEELRDAGDLEPMGGLEYIEQLAQYASILNLDHHISRLKELSTRRRVHRAARDVMHMVTHDPMEAADLVDRVEREILTATADTRRAKGMVRVGTRVWPVMQGLEQGEMGLPSGFSDLDRMLGGFHPGDLLILAGRPGMAKTSMMLNLAANVAIGQGLPVGLWSLEMSDTALTRRLIASEARVNLHPTRTGPKAVNPIQDHEYPRIGQAAGIVNGAPIWIDDSPSISVSHLRAAARRLKQENPNLALLAVDYLQLMHGEGENRTQQVGDISRGLKAVAKELGVPVLALSQLSRAVETRPDKRPMMSDLRESGSIEQDADVILFLYRPEYYFGPTDKEGNSLEGRAELIVAKQRNGDTGMVPLAFHKEITRFEALSHRTDPSERPAVRRVAEL